MKLVTIMVKDKPIIQFETEIDDFVKIAEMIYWKYKDEVWFKIEPLEKGKVKK